MVVNVLRESAAGEAGAESAQELTIQQGVVDMSMASSVDMATARYLRLFLDVYRISTVKI